MRLVAAVAVMVWMAASVGAAQTRVQAEDPLTAAEARRNAATTAEEMEAATRPYVAQLLLRMGEVEALDGHRTRAVELDEQAVNLDESGATRLEAAERLLRMGEPAKAADVLRPGMVELAASAQAWGVMGTAERDSGHETEAIESLGRSLKLSPEISTAYALGATLLQVHRKADAQRLFADIFAVSGNLPLWHVAVGDAYREARYYEDAVKEFETAIKLDPKALHAEFFLGLTYLQMNEWGPNSQSFEHLRRAVALNPKEYVSNFYLGALESTDGSDLAASDRHLRAAAEADGTQPEVWIYLGLNANRQHNTAEAEADLRKAIALTGADESRNGWQVRRAYFALGRLLIASGRREEGLALLEKYKGAQQAAVAASGETIGAMAAGADAPAALDAATLKKVERPVPEATSAVRLTAAQETALRTSRAALTTALAAGFNDLGTAEARRQEYAEALKNFEEAGRWGTPTETLLRNTGAAAFRVEDYAAASKALTAYFAGGATEEKDPRAALMLGYSAFHEGRFAEAARAFDGAKTATMGDDRAAYSLAFALERTGHAQEANAIAGELEKRPLAPEILSLVCHLYVDGENWEGSLRCYRRAYGEDAGLKLAHYEAGQALVHLDRPQEALAELEQEQKLDPQNANVEYAVDYAMLQAGEKEKAQERLAALVKAHPEHGPAQYQLGKLLLDEGRTAAAVEHLEASEKDDGGVDYVHYQLGTAYRKAGRTADAERELREYKEMKDAKRAASAVRD